MQPAYDWRFYINIMQETDADWLMVESPSDHGDGPRRCTELAVKPCVVALRNMSAQRRTSDLWWH